MDPDAPSAVDADGFGGYTALYSSVVSQRGFWVNYGKGQPHEARFTRLLLERGANPNIRASLRARLEEGHGGGLVQRLPQRDTARVGRTIPRTHFREPRGGSVDRGERRRSSNGPFSIGTGVPRFSLVFGRSWTEVGLKFSFGLAARFDAVIDG